MSKTKNVSEETKEILSQRDGLSISDFKKLKGCFFLERKDWLSYYYWQKIEAK